MSNRKDYIIGLDIGTNSVGWSVLSEDYKLLKKRIKIQGDSDKPYVKKNLWGVRLFDGGQTAADRRLKRTTRRRLARRKNRLKYLQCIFDAEMQKVDDSFFIRLEDSFLVPEDKRGSRHPIFATLEEEKTFHEEFPTIYHLRKHLADSKEKADLRLIYLALAHIIKFRGHFLIEGKLETENTSIAKTFKSFYETYLQLFASEANQSVSVDELADNTLESLFTAKVSPSQKAESVLNLFPNEKSNGALAQFVKMMVGNQGNFKGTFSLEEDAKIQFSKEDLEGDLESLYELIGEEFQDLFNKALATYNAVQLSGILTAKDTATRAPLSASMIERYSNHEEDLRKFKAFIKQHLPEAYFDMFKNDSGKSDGYAGYIRKGVTQEDFYKYVKKVITGINGAEYFLDKIDQGEFLRKQRTFDNGVIPHQIHLEELKAILQKQAPYYEFLGINEDKICSLLTFRIPYYVGPLAKKAGDFSWIVRTKEEHIRPWNFTDFVDSEKSAVKFIEKMTNIDEYLPTEKVLPKHSLLYEKFAVFNELTKTRYSDDTGREHLLSSDEKSRIFDSLFKTNRKVSKKDVENLLHNEFNIETPKVLTVENKFNSSFGTYQDLIKVGIPNTVLDDPKSKDTLEKIVEILTVFEDRKMIRKQLEQFENLIDGKILKKLERRHYTGWGRLSRKMIDGIKDKDAGKTILDYLESDDGVHKNINRNFMQLINDDTLSFKLIISEAQKNEESTNIVETVRDLPGSPAIKKGIVQSLKIVEELVGVMGYDPKTIVVEMARENQSTGQGKKRSQPRYKRLEEAIQKLGSQVLKEHPTDNKSLQDDRLFLYYLQNGKDMYEPNKNLDISQLYNYDIDHIIPQSFTTDNSIDNRVLVSSSTNRAKSNGVPSVDIVKRAEPYWRSLLSSGLMSQRKFDNLTKISNGGLSDVDRAKFIKRQLVETRQITKHVARLIDNRFNTEKDEKGRTIRHVQIVTLKSALVSQFRKTFEIYKIRELNDHHHAHDAYLNGVVANALLKVYPNLAPEFVYGDYRKFNSFKENKATAKKQFYTNIVKFFAETTVLDESTGEILWTSESLSTIRKVIGYHQVNVVKKIEKQKGGFSKESIQPKGNSDKLIRRKNNLDPKKYGGFDSPTIAYSVVINYEKGAKRKPTKAIVGISIMERDKFERDEKAFLIDKGYENPSVIKLLPKYTLFEFADGRRRLVASAKESQKGNQMVLPSRLVTLLYHAKHYSDDKTGDSKKYVTGHKDDFEELFEIIKRFADDYTLATANVDKVEKLYYKNKNSDLAEVSQAFINLLQLNAAGAPADFKFFGTNIPRKRYTSLNELLKSSIIDQSITGLYETRTKVDG